MPRSFSANWTERRYFQSTVTLALMALLFAAVTVAVGLSLNRYSTISFERIRSDSRFEGIMADGTSRIQASFSDDRLWPGSTVLQFSVTPKSAEVKVQALGDGPVIESVQNGSQLLFELSPSAATGRIELTCSDQSVNADPLGCKFRINSARIRPGALLVLPTFEFGWPYVLGIAGLLILGWLAFQGSLRVIVLILISIGCVLILSQSHLDNWPKLLWPEMAIDLALIGYIIGRRFNHCPALLDKKTVLALGLLTLIFSIGLFLRFYGIAFGLPDLFHPDEAHKLNRVRNMLITADLNPRYFKHPTFLLYGTLFFAYINNLWTGTLPSISTIALCGRGLSALFGSLSILLVFLIGTRIFNRAAGLLAALILAISPLHVVCSRYMKEDAILLFFVLASFYFALRAIEKPKESLFLLSGISAGFAASTKYSGVLAFAFVIWAAGTLWLRARTGSEFKRVVRWGFYSLIAAMVGFLIFTPYALIDSHRLVSHITLEGNHMLRGHTVPITAWDFFWSYHLRQSIIPGLTWPIALVSLVGIGFVLYRPNHGQLMVIGSIFLFYLPAEWVNAKPPPQPERYILPCIPFLSILVGGVVSNLLNRLFAHMNKLSAAVRLCTDATIVTVLSLLLADAALLTTLQTVGLYRDTRHESRAWIIKNIPHGSKLVMDWKYYGPARLSEFYDLTEFKSDAGRDLLTNLSVQRLRDYGADYIILSSFFYDRYLDPTARGHFLRKRFSEVFEKLPLVAEFNHGPNRYGFHNPVIKVLAVKESYVSPN